ncbi:MAG: helix-turn-helix transcriptional regulator, partial [Ruminococcus sp.]|nr:helix-turn-helix transcriptional regulator [Ruminococcus sp.]
EKYNYSQNDIAKKINITQQAYANYENGNRLPNIEILIKIADIYDISLDILTGRYTKAE